MGGRSWKSHQRKKGPWRIRSRLNIKKTHRSSNSSWHKEELNSANRDTVVLAQKKKEKRGCAIIPLILDSLCGSTGVSRKITMA